MVNLKSEYYYQYYGKKIFDYDIKFIHNNLEFVKNTNEEYKLIEEDLEHVKTYCKESFLIFFTEYKDLVIALGKTNIFKKYNDYIYYKIKSDNDYKKYKELNIDIKLLIDIDDLNKIKPSKEKIVLQIDKVSNLPKNKLNELRKKYNIVEVSVGQIAYIWKDNIKYLDMLEDYYGIEKYNQVKLEKCYRLTNDIYSINEYKLILDRLNSIICKNKADSLVKTMKNIFMDLARSINYDFAGDKVTNIESQNLIGPLFKNLGVCEGYSKVLEQIYSLIDINTITVSGGGIKDEGGHIWNQVELDGKWYNLDLTYQSTSIRQNLGYNMFLISDDKCLYQSKSIFAHVCTNDYKGDD